MSEESLLAGDGGQESGQQDQPQQNQGTPPASDNPERLDFVLDKYRAEGRTEAEAMELQAKSYAELNTKFGSFTGAPEGDYEVAISEELAAEGIELDSDNELLKGVSELAKELNMSQEGFNKLVDLYLKNDLATMQAIDDRRGQEIQALGSNAGQRINAINAYISKNFDASTVEAIQMMATSSESIKALEALIQRGQSAPIAPEAPAAPSVSESDVKAMQFELDANGNRRINTDPAFKKQYLEKMALLHGDAEYRQMIGPR